MGAMGAMLAITGIFGMAAYSVSKRLRELGIRLALGAQRSQVLQAALGRAVRLLALGSAVGLLLGILASRVLAAIVYEATPRDPLVLAGVVVAMALLGLSATWIPARRALSVDPVILLREQWTHEARPRLEGWHSGITHHSKHKGRTFFTLKMTVEGVTQWYGCSQLADSLRRR